MRFIFVTLLALWDIFEQIGNWHTAFMETTILSLVGRAQAIS